MKPRIEVCRDSRDWPVLADGVIAPAISSAISIRGLCQLMLTGGRTAESLYRHWAENASLPLQQIRFLFGDERCVPPGHEESNFRLAMNTLLPEGMPEGCSIERMQADRPDREAAARAYEELLPEEIDVLLLGLGPDGHIASLFPRHPALRQDGRNVVPVSGPKPPFQRLTVTPRVIARARSVFVLANGVQKGRVLAEALREPEDIYSLPVRLALKGTWILDPEAGNQLKGFFKNPAPHSKDLT